MTVNGDLKGVTGDKATPQLFKTGCSSTNTTTTGAATTVTSYQ